MKTGRGTRSKPPAQYLRATGVSADQPDNTFERPAGLLCPDIVASLVVLVPKARPGVFLLVAVLHDPNPLTLACIYRHDAPSRASILLREGVGLQVPVIEWLLEGAKGPPRDIP